MLDVNHLCPGCMSRWEDTGRPCPRCGFSWETAPAGGRELPIFTILAGRYLLGKRIGVGGFGITYLAMDLAEERVTAIKEFFPASLASREGLEVAALPGEEGRYFREALRSFRKEADLLSRFVDVPGIVRYRDYVMENGTAYLVMDYIEGTNLRRYMRETGKTFTQEEALGLMHPILLAVDAMHRKNVLHRDISPENLILKPDGTLTLIDFGAAREFSLDEEENLTVILKHGYAPEEQYHSGSRQGPWTDLYACCAVLYQMVSGIQPQDAAARAQKDNLLTLDEIEGVQVTEKFARVIEKGMTIHATERYASIQALTVELYGDCAEQPERKKDEPEEQEPEEWKPECKAESTERALKKKEQSDKELSFGDKEIREEDYGRKNRYKFFGKAAAVFTFLLIALLVWISTKGPSYIREDGVVWLVTGEKALNSPYYSFFEYNEHGNFDTITSYGSSETNYASVAGIFYSTIDDSYGEIVSDFAYEYDKNGKIISAAQRTDSGIEYRHQYIYWDNSSDIPKEIIISVSDEDDVYRIEVKQDGLIDRAEMPDGVRMNFMYAEEKCTNIQQTVSYVNSDQEKVLRFVNECLEQGMEVDTIENGNGTYTALARYSIKAPEGLKTKVLSVHDLYSYNSASLMSEGERDEYGNVTEDDWGIYSYAEYEVKDGIYTPTGRTSGTLPEISGEVQRDDSEEIQEDGSGNFTGGTEGASSENTASFADTGKQDDLLELLERYGIGYMTVDEVKEEYPDNAEEYIVTAMRTGDVMSLVGCRITTLEGLASGFYAVLPPEDWFLDDGTEAWTILTADMRTCWEISEALLEEGYYTEGGKAWGFFGHLSGTGADAEGSGLICRENDPLRFEIYAQYLEYWGERTGKDWSITNPDTGETVSKNE